MNKPRILKQAVMLRTLYALVPVLMVAIYYFGWRVFFLVLTSFVVAFGTEWIMAEQRKGKISTACFVTAAIYGLSLPPTTPFWIAAVGAGVAILFGKEVFGGFGRNVFNPAVVGRAFVYICFPVELTSRFVPVFRGFPGGFSHWGFGSLKTAPSYLAEKGLSLVDAVTTATPMWARRDYDYLTGLGDLALGSIGGVFKHNGYDHALAAGSAGEVCAVVILLSGVYLLYTKTAQYRLITGTIAGAVGINILLRHGLGLMEIPPVWFTLFSGALLYGAVFMVTDPVSAPNQPVSQWIYSVFIGVMIVFFRWKAVFAGGVAFSILLGNMLAPSLDLWVKRYRSYRKKDRS